MKDKSAIIQAVLVLFGTFGIIVPLAIWMLPSTGKFAQAPLFEGGQDTMVRPPKSRLSLYVRGLNELSLNSKAPLRATQFARLTAVIAPWLQRATMSDRQAETLLRKLAAALTQEQQSYMQQWQASYGGYGPPPLSNDWQGRAIQQFRDTYNPFYAPAKHRLFSVLPPEMQERYQMRFDERMTFLKQWREGIKPQAPPKSITQ